MSNQGLSFGVACIDSLIAPKSLAYNVNSDKAPSEQKPVVACIAGPDGVGKSILSLTAASTFASSMAKADGRVVYASTDLNFLQANKAWQYFGLDHPLSRHESLLEYVDQFQLTESQKSTWDKRKPTVDKCDLVWLSPFAKLESRPPQGLNEYRELFPTSSKRAAKNNAVYLLDLAAYSGGDDWSLINHTVGLLKNQFPKKNARNLLVVDAVEGLEAMAGNRDRFGLFRTRRSRLAQLVRLARKANCNVIFVIEQGEKNKHLDEVFVSDLVIKLRSEKIDGYMQKTIEIEKARGIPHVRGIHELQIRSGGGGSPSGVAVPDDPCVRFPKNKVTKQLSYLQVIPSLHVKKTY